MKALGFQHVLEGYLNIEIFGKKQTIITPLSDNDRQPLSST